MCSTAPPSVPSTSLPTSINPQPSDERQGPTGKLAETSNHISLQSHLVADIASNALAPYAQTSDSNQCDGEHRSELELEFVDAENADEVSCRCLLPLSCRPATFVWLRPPVFSCTYRCAWTKGLGTYERHNASPLYYYLCWHFRLPYVVVVTAYPSFCHNAISEFEHTVRFLLGTADHCTNVAARMLTTARLTTAPCDRRRGSVFPSCLSGIHREVLFVT